jgi:hypothetical protein
VEISRGLTHTTQISAGKLRANVPKSNIMANKSLDSVVIYCCFVSIPFINTQKLKETMSKVFPFSVSLVEGLSASRSFEREN